MKLEKTVARPLTGTEAACILQVLERMGQKKTAEKYRLMVEKALPVACRGKSGEMESTVPVSSRQKILSGIFSQECGEMAAAVAGYLFMKRDLLLHAGILEPGKSMDGCMCHIMEMAKRQAEKDKKNAVAFRDGTVYGWAEEYFTSAPCRITEAPSVTFTEPEKRAVPVQTGKRKRKKKAAAGKPETTGGTGQDSEGKQDRNMQTKGEKTVRGKAGGQISLFDVYGGMEG